MWPAQLCSQMDGLKNDTTSRLCPWKFCAPSRSQLWIETRIIGRERWHWDQINDFVAHYTTTFHLMTLTINRAPHRCSSKHCAPFQSHRCLNWGYHANSREKVNIQSHTGQIKFCRLNIRVTGNPNIEAKFILACVTLNFDLWPWTLHGHCF